MRFLRFLVACAVVISQMISIVPSSRALSPTGIVISHVIAGETNQSNSEFVALYNNGAADVDMTGNCLWSGSYEASPITCIEAEANTRVFIKSHGYLTIASTVFAANHAYVPDTTYLAANRIAVGSDSVYLKDAASNEVDRVTWSSGKLSTGSALQRKETAIGSGILMDTDALDPSADFVSVAAPVVPANASYDVVTIVDACPNLPDLQRTVPGGYLADSNGECQPDSCLNMDGLQVNVPDGYDSDSDGTCTPHDECDNVSGVQGAIPTNMVRKGFNDCAWMVDPLQLTEVFPNAVGSDTGNEFIEIYNPTERTVDLSLYNVAVGLTADKTYAFPIGAMIAPREYRAFSDSVMKFTLVNSTSRVVLGAIDGSTLSDSGPYQSPAEGESWALIDNVWQYTNQPTPNDTNARSIPIDTQTTGSVSSLPAPCAAGKYRNPLTNRCRTILTDAAVLATCDTDQYRNPETGRCRKITTANVAPCKDGQYRSEETNRCRNIATVSSQKPCKDAQYRSEETGRCRNLPVSSVPSAGFAVQPVKDTGMAFVGWWALGGTGLLAAGHAGWEWRRELAMLWRSAIDRFR